MASAVVLASVHRRSRQPLTTVVAAAVRHLEQADSTAAAAARGTAAAAARGTAAVAGRDTAVVAGHDMAAAAGRDTAVVAGHDTAAVAGRDTAVVAGRDTVVVAGRDSFQRFAAAMGTAAERTNTVAHRNVVAGIAESGVTALSKAAVDSADEVAAAAMKRAAAACVGLICGVLGPAPVLAAHHLSAEPEVAFVQVKKASFLPCFDSLRSVVFYLR